MSPAPGKTDRDVSAATRRAWAAIIAIALVAPPFVDATDRTIDPLSWILAYVVYAQLLAIYFVASRARSLGGWLVALVAGCVVVSANIAAVAFLW